MSRSCERLLADFCTFQSSKNQPPVPLKKLSEISAEVQKFAEEFSHGLDLFIANSNFCVQFLDMDDMEIFSDLVDFAY